MNVARFLTTGLSVVIALAGGGGPTAAGGFGRRPSLGDPLEGLTRDQLQLFIDGKEVFEEEEATTDGLGPIFNDVGCAACHSAPVVGGGSPLNETRAARLTGNNYFEFPGGSLFQTQAISANCAEAVPSDANVRALRQTQPLFGSGLIEAIPDRSLEIYRLLQAKLHPAQAGRVHRVVDVMTGASRVGRFGWKAQQATLLAFSGDAYLNEMGITSPRFPTENAPNGDLAKLTACDTVPDPEDEGEDVEAFANFMRLLAPPPRQYSGRRDSDRQDGDRFSQSGISLLNRAERLFESVGCGVCHRSGFIAVSRIAAIHGKRVDAFSDFLLHDVGTGDGIIQGGARGNEFRTPPLWGISDSAPYLHDGSAQTIPNAIERHGNQGAAARNAFRELSFAERDVLLKFLDSI